MSEEGRARPYMDWQQVILNGGPPCFALAGDLDTHYCGRAQRWSGHDNHHKFVSLDDLLTTARKEEREAAILEAKAAMREPSAGTLASVEFHRGFESMRRLAVRAIEAAASTKGENDG